MSLRSTMADKGEPMAVYQALAPATRQLATTPPFTVSHWLLRRLDRNAGKVWREENMRTTRTEVPRWALGW
jgi:hypothetical protein